MSNFRANPAKGPGDEFAAILAAARDGDEMAFEMLWRSHNPRLTHFVQARVYNSGLDYEEIVSEAWISVAKDIRKFQGDAAAFSSWLYTIARNRLIDASRRRDRQAKADVEIEEAFWLPDQANLERDFEADEAVLAIIAKINQLPVAQAEVVYLRVVADKSVEETAEIVKKNANAVRVLAHRGLATLRELMAEQ
jgi:RNA polymerase sigma-70 factor (ECF subfamily)